MICEKCKLVRHSECLGTTWCDCQHRTPAVLLGAHAPVAPDCICREQVDGTYGRFAVPPPGGCPTHGGVKAHLRLVVHAASS